MTLKALEKYCIDQGIKMAGKAKENEAEKPWAERYYAGRANAFMWIAACIQNDSFEEKNEGDAE